MTHQDAIDSLAAERYLLDEMSELERHQFEEHYFTCRDCAEDVRASSLMQREVREGSGRAAAPPHAESRVLRPRPTAWMRAARLTPWAAAAMLALVVGYQSLVLVPEIRRAVVAEAVVPVALRAASRGELPGVAVDTGQRIVSLALDVDAGSGPERIAYSLRGPDGSGIASGDAPSPPPGMPLMLVVSARSVAAPGVYLVSVRSQTGTVEYGFRVTPQ